MSEIWFTADTHFGHGNIIGYCNRPFESAQHMDNILIQNLNAVVKPNDILYHLGDFSFGGINNVQKYLDRIACNTIYLILGNHDKHIRKKPYQFRFKSALDVFVDKINNQSMTLHHYAMRVWHKSHFGAWHLYGHSHGTLSVQKNSLDVGVDNQDYGPISFEEVAKQIKEYYDQ